MKNIYQPQYIRKFSNEFDKRSIFMLLLAFILVLILIFRLYFIQVTQHQHYIAESDNNRIQIKAIPPVRGKIYDRKGRLLAGNSVFYNLSLVVERSENLDDTLTKLKKLVDIPDDELAKFNKNKRYRRAYEPVVLKRMLSEIDIAKIEVNQHQLPGVEILNQYDRFYTKPVVFSHVLGYVGRINKKEMETIDKGDYRRTNQIGKIGIEKSYEDALHGTAGFKKVETDSHGKILHTLEVTNPVAGSDIYLTIDSELQELAHELMQGKRGSIVAFDPNTFEVLTMLSSPGYDTNLFINGISYKDYDSLRNDIDLPLFNRSLRGQYPPGSTIKPFVALAGLETGVIKKNNKVFCKGYYQIKNTKRKFRDWKKSGHGNTNMKKAITESCDVYFYDLAYNLGIDRIKPYINLFGFGRKTEIDLPYETAGFVPSREWKKLQTNPKWNPGETLNVGIGQGKLQITPLQIAYATAVLANYGKALMPSVVFRTQKPGNNRRRQNPPRKTTATLDSEIPIKRLKNWHHIIDSMQSVVHSNRGTARIINNGSYKIAGKTGTAQVFTIKQTETYDEEKLAERLHDHALFIAFAPVDNPHIAIAVIVENGKHGGSTAAPIAKSIMDKYLLEIMDKPETTDEKPA